MPNKTTAILFTDDCNGTEDAAWVLRTVITDENGDNTHEGEDDILDITTDMTREQALAVASARTGIDANDIEVN